MRLRMDASAEITALVTLATANEKADPSSFYVARSVFMDFSIDYVFRYCVCASK